MKNKKALVLGCGVSGLTCGVRLLEEGFKVRIAAYSLPPETTSNVAPAYWYPYKVNPQQKVLAWASRSYNRFMELSGVPGSGIHVSSLLKMFRDKVEDPFWLSAVRFFRRAGRDELPPGYTDGFLVEVPRIETPVYIPYLMKLFVDMGGTIEKLDSEIKSLDEIGGVGLVVNCLGLGSREVCNDLNMYPIRGQIVKVKVEGLSTVVSVELGPDAPIYIVPRDEDCVLGGTAEDNDWSLDVNPRTTEAIIKKCEAIEPALAGAKIIGHKVGLRPGRTEVRLEAERLKDGAAVIHNYGHGGAGFTLSWGCAEDVARLARE